MPNVTVDHALAVKKAVLSVERSNHRSITDKIRCLAVMQEERGAARLILDQQAINAMRLMNAALDKALETQAKLGEAHAAMVGITDFFDVPGFGPHECVPNTPGDRIASLHVAA